jgi:capsid protein
MNLLNPLSWFRSSPRASAAPTQSAARHAIRARYDNALTTDENQRNWALADILSAKAANSYQIRRTLRTRSRYEVANNPYLFGICNSNADDLIDTGPTLQVLTDDSSYNRQIEAQWNEWAQEVNLVEKLRTCKLARTVDGEGFLVLKTVEDLYNSVKLFPVDIEADQVTSPAPKSLDLLWIDGLTVHPITGQPVSYQVLKHHPGDLWFRDFNPIAVETVAKRFVIHWFPKFRPGQVRGIPIFTSALDLFGELRAYRRAVLQKAQIAANFTAVLQTEASPDQSGADTRQPFDNIPIDRGTMTTLPGGNTLKQFETGEPSTTYDQFQEKCLGEACRPLCYPLNRALGTSQKFNFSSAKLDHIDYRSSLRVERAQCESTCLNPLFAAWFDEGQKIPKYFPAGANLAQTPHEWHWPGFPTLDAAADTKADIGQINAGTMTWREFWASRGYDWREVMEQQSREREEIERLGLVFGDPLKRTEKTDDAEETADAT